MFLDIQKEKKRKSLCAANSNSGSWQQTARGHKVDLSLFFERLEQKKIIWTIHLTIKH